MAASVLCSLLLTCVLVASVDGSGKKQLGHWAAWEALSPCTVSCGTGVQTQLRRWVKGRDDPPSKDKFTSTRSFVCSSKKYRECPQDGRWTEWFNWGSCSKACGRGTRVRTRYCYPPRNGGRKCKGKPEYEQVCSRAPCPRLPSNFDMSQCTSPYNYTCGSERMCVLRSQRCDGTVHCHDGTDEESCPKTPRTGYSVRYGLSIGGGSDHVHPSTLGLVTAFSMVSIVVALHGH